MIERNLGNAERLVRLGIGVMFALWMLGQPHPGMVEGFVGLVALMLILNGVFSRCYLWYLIDLNTHSDCRA